MGVESKISKRLLVDGGGVLIMRGCLQMGGGLNLRWFNVIAAGLLVLLPAPRVVSSFVPRCIFSKFTQKGCVAQILPPFLTSRVCSLSLSHLIACLAF